MAIPVENFFLDNTTPGTLQTRVQQMIASGILSGRFEQGEKLPSTRKLAEYLGVSRITVSLAFTEILAKSLMKNGVLIEPGKNFFAPPNQLENYYRLAFSSINEEKIEGGIKLVADLIKKFTD